MKLIGPGGHETHADLQDKDDGTYLVTYCVTAAGTHDVHVTIGEPICFWHSSWTAKALEQCSLAVDSKAGLLPTIVCQVLANQQD